MKNYKAVILDRDGVINHDSADYIKSVDEWLPIDGAIDAIAQLKKAGLIVAVASNQSGVGRGYFDLTALQAMHAKLHGLLAAQHTKLDRLYFCPHHPDDNCHCRKPKTGMLEQFARDFSLTKNDIVFIGDTYSDWQCAQQFGCAFIHVLTGKGEQQKSKLPTDLTSVRDLADALHRI